MPQQTLVISGRARRRPGLGAVSGVLGIGILGVAALMPPNFVVESAGPTFNTLGSYDSHELVGIEGARTYPTSGSLDLTTVYVAGGPNSATSSLAVLNAYLDPGRTAVPSDAVYSPQTTSEQVSQQNTAQMSGSQSAAQAAAATYLKKDFTTTLKVTGLTEDSVVTQLKAGDVITSVDGKKIADRDTLTDAVQASGGHRITLGYLPDGQGSEQTLTVAPRRDDQRDAYQLGVYLQVDYHFPFTVDYGLEQVGGPSAGTMFALGIIDKMTEQDMTGGKHFAGTGTIDAEGEIGAIGGIRQKMIGARQAGAEYFLAPGKNCDEVVGHVPEGLSVVKADTLTEAADAVRGIGEGKDPGDFPQCGS